MVGGDSFAGRLSVRVEPTGSAPARSLAAAFDLRGSAAAGSLGLSTPLGSMLAQARWQPGSVVLVTPQGSRRFADLDALTREVLGESVPIEAWFDWLHGRPWPGAREHAAGRGDRLRAARLDGRPRPASPPARSRPRGASRCRRSACGSSSTAREGSGMSLPALYDVPAPAKLNLFLHVVGRRDDGYHLIDSLMLPIDWCDTLHFERRDDGRLARHDLGEPLPADDLCLRAARALQQAAGTPLRRRHLDREAPALGRRARRRQLRRRLHPAGAEPPLGPGLAARAPAADRPRPRRRRAVLPRRPARPGRRHRRAADAGDAARRPGSPSSSRPPAWRQRGCSAPRRWREPSRLLESRAFPRPSGARLTGSCSRGNRAGTRRRLRAKRSSGRGRSALSRGVAGAGRASDGVRQQPDDRLGKRGLRPGGRRPGALGSDAERLAQGWSSRMCRSPGAPSARELGPAGSVKFEGAQRELRTGVGESPSWLRHRILIPTCEGSNPSSPAKSSQR